eukprot:jgi/Hompol1/1032/HPOL_005498-RA
MTSKESGEPQIAPIRSLTELAAWSLETADPFMRCAVAKRPRPSSRPKPLPPAVAVCHDMAGGYKEDQNVQGNNGRSSIYSIQYWQFIDSFIYFAHERLSIPPPSWSAAAHRNGVDVYATFITEWTGNIEENMKLIYGPQYHPDLPSTSYRFSPFFADKMVELAKHCSFEGWFINIEAPLPAASHAPVFEQFLRYLTNKMHKEISGGKVMMYDSLTRSGRIDWQDKLSAENKLFFDASDSLFVNYTWKADYPSQSAEAAGKGSELLSADRSMDVFTGIDVWGRNTFGGGGFNVHKALRHIVESGTSCAIFAPAWTYESLGIELFEKHERRFWCDSDLDISESDAASGRRPRGKDGDLLDLPATFVDILDKGCVADYVTPRPAPSESFFYSCFDRGFGNQYYYNGQIVSHQPWSHIARQSIPPTYRTDNHWHIASIDTQLVLPNSKIPILTTAAKNGASVFELSCNVVGETAWIGGASLELSVSVSAASPSTAVFDVFDVASKSCTQYASIRFKSDSATNVALSIRSVTSDRIAVFMPLTSTTDANGWTLSEFDLSHNTVAGDQICTVGIAVLLPSSNEPLVCRLHIGEIYAGPAAHHTQLILQSLSFVDVFTDERDCDSVWVSAKWDMSDIYERGEVFVDGVWRGTSFLDRFRLQLPAVRDAQSSIAVKLMNACGKLVGEASGSYRQ